LIFQDVQLVEYNQKRDIFESGLSILDVMMFNNVERINQFLDNYELITPPPRWIGVSKNDFSRFVDSNNYRLAA
jgi:hypothetical protein